MGSELLALLEKEAAAERDRVLAEARAQAEEIRAAAEGQARQVVESQRQQQEAALRTSRARAQGTAHLAAQALLLEEKDRSITEVFRRAKEALDQVLHDRARYAPVLGRLIEEGLQGFNGPIIIEAHPDDVALVKEQLEGSGIRRKLAQQDANWQPEVRSAADVRGGVRLASPDGRYVVLNTLASRLERARPTLASEVARTLWR